MIKKIKLRRKINFPTKAVLNFLKEKSDELLDLAKNILIDQDQLIKNAGFNVKYPSVGSAVCRWLSKLDEGSSFKQKNGKIYLTNKGRLKIIKNIVKEKNKTEKWDGKWRAVIFDTPEATRHERRFLRAELKWMGFRYLQKSIWVCPYNVEKELFALLKLWKIDFRGDIRFLEINKIEDDKDLRKSFKL